MVIYNICDMLTTSVVKHVQLQKMAGFKTTTSYRRGSLIPWASERCGHLFSPANTDTIYDAIKASDIVMIHTSTDSAGLVKMFSGCKPTVWACHDYVQGSEADVRVDACIVPSDGYIDMIQADFPVFKVHRKVAAADWPVWANRRINCTVMPGVVSSNDQEPWRNYEFARDLLGGNMLVMSAVLPSRMTDKYMVMECCTPQRMLCNMTRFSSSWCGSGSNVEELGLIVNNKYFESIAAGCVPILYRSAEMSKHAAEHNCGITWDGYLPNEGALSGVRQHIIANKREFALESEIPQLNRVIKAVIKGA